MISKCALVKDAKYSWNIKVGVEKSSKCCSCKGNQNEVLELCWLKKNCDNDDQKLKVRPKKIFFLLYFSERISERIWCRNRRNLGDNFTSEGLKIRFSEYEEVLVVWRQSDQFSEKSVCLRMKNVETIFFWAKMMKKFFEDEV